MKYLIPFTLLSLVSCAATPRQAVATGQDQRINIYLGQRNLDEGDWEPLDEQGTFGLEYSAETEGSIGWEFGLMGSADDGSVLGVDVDGRTFEIYGGLHKSWGHQGVRPYVGGGISLINGEIEVGPIEDDDSSPAGYVHGGLVVDVSDAFYIGLDLRVLFGSDIELFGVSGDADYEQLALIFGVGF